MRLLPRNSEYSIVIGVSDNYDYSNTISVLQNMDVTLKAMNYGASILEKIEHNPPDLLLLSTELEDMSGHQVAETITKQLRYTNIPVIFLLDNSDPDERVACFESGATDCLSSPFHVDEMVARIKNHINRRKVEKDRDHLHTLLLNVLPGRIVEQLSSGDTPPPEHHDDICVLFADFVGFTSISRDIGPTEAVNLLNKFFFTFDQITEHLGVERVKTIGDGYMAISGTNARIDNPLLRTLLSAQKFNEVVEAHNRHHDVAWSIRSGIDIGEVIAGIVGHSRMAFDVWGNTVNIASRLEELGKAGEVTLSENAIDCVAPQAFEITKREHRELANWGAMTIHHGHGLPEAAPFHLRELYEELDVNELINEAADFSLDSG